MIQTAFNRAGDCAAAARRTIAYQLDLPTACIHCPNSNNLALSIFFAGAGFLLVFLFGVLNLTVTQGVISGLVFYANAIIMDLSQSVLFAQTEEYTVIVVLKAFIAWVNLDFGIKT